MELTNYCDAAPSLDLSLDLLQPWELIFAEDVVIIPEILQIIFTAMWESLFWDGKSMIEGIRAIAEAAAISQTHRVDLSTFLVSRVNTRIYVDDYYNGETDWPAPFIHSRDILFLDEIWFRVPLFTKISAYDKDGCEYDTICGGRWWRSNEECPTTSLLCIAGRHQLQISIDGRTKEIKRMEYEVAPGPVQILYQKSTSGAAPDVDLFPLIGYPRFALRFLDALFPCDDDRFMMAKM